MNNTYVLLINKLGLDKIITDFQFSIKEKNNEKVKVIYDNRCACACSWFDCQHGIRPSYNEIPGDQLHPGQPEPERHGSHGQLLPARWLRLEGSGCNSYPW